MTNSTTMLSAVMSQSAVATTQYSVSASKQASGMDFQTMFSNASEGAKTSTKVEAKSEVKSETVEKPEAQIKADNAKISQEVDKDLEDAEVDAAIEELEEQIVQTVTKEFGVSEEELLEAMEALGLTITDLLGPGNVMQVMMQLAQTDNPLEVITDAKMSEMFKSVGTQLEQLLSDTAKELNLTEEQLVDLLETKEMTVDVETDMPQQVSKEPMVQQENQAMTQQEDGAKDFSKQGESSQADVNESVMTRLDSTVRQVFEAAPAEATAHVDVENIIRQINNAVRVNMTQGQTTMELQLNPENLGKVNIQVVSKDGVITATITATEEAVKKALESQIVSLKDNLNNQGIKVEAVEVTIASHSFEQQDSEKSNQQEMNSSTTRRFRYDDELVEESVVEEEIIDSNSTINYTA